MTGALPLLVEIGTEELPPTSLTALERAFGQLIGEALLIEGFEHDRLQTFATPRRLSIVINSIATTQPDQAIERRGPAVTAAYDQTGHRLKRLLVLLDPAGYLLIHRLRPSRPTKGHGSCIEPLHRG